MYFLTTLHSDLQFILANGLSISSPITLLTELIVFNKKTKNYCNVATSNGLTSKRELVVDDHLLAAKQLLNEDIPFYDTKKQALETAKLLKLRSYRCVKLVNLTG